MWEKLCDDGSPQDVHELFSWRLAFDKISKMNFPPCYLGYCDWRMPNRFEMESILSMKTANPAVLVTFNTNCTPGCTVLTCSCTAWHSAYWTSTTHQLSTIDAWVVDFGAGQVMNNPKNGESHLRAVRGGT